MRPRCGANFAKGHNLNKLGKGPLNEATYQMSML